MPLKNNNKKSGCGIKSYRYQYSSILFLNGYIDKYLLNFIDMTKCIIAADGAYQKLRSMNVKPDYVIGDGDSFVSIEKSQEYIFEEDQNCTDFEKCLAKLQKNKLLPTIIIGISGNEIDHTYGNLAVLLKYISFSSVNAKELLFLDSFESEGEKKVKIGMAIKKGAFLFNVYKDAKISFFPSFGTVFSTKGLQYDVKDFLFDKGSILPIRNIATDNLFQLNVEKGEVIVISDFL